MAPFDETRESLAGIGLPTGDDAGLADSPHRFPDGGQYKWELAGAIDAAAAELLLEKLEAASLRLDQFTYTEGIVRLTDAEIAALVKVVGDADRQLVMAPGPRGVWDIGGQSLAPSPAAKASSYRLRGMEQVVRAVDDVRRAVDLGVRGFLIFDEGLLDTLVRLRAAGELPAEARFKASSNMGVGNPAHARAIAALGADSINLQRDLDLSMIASARAVTEVPFDLHTDNPGATGGFLRTWEIPDMIRVAAPVYLKTGNAAQIVFDAPLGPREIGGIVHQMELEAETIARHAPDLRPSLEREF
ncbi:MAG: peptidase [Actinobacteria bacterium]|nr:peptidase [Actinomycetota bacterium]